MSPHGGERSILDALSSGFEGVHPMAPTFLCMVLVVCHAIADDLCSFHLGFGSCGHDDTLVLSVHSMKKFWAECNAAAADHLTDVHISGIPPPEQCHDSFHLAVVAILRDAPSAMCCCCSRPLVAVHWPLTSPVSNGLHTSPCGFHVRGLCKPLDAQ